MKIKFLNRPREEKENIFLWAHSTERFKFVCGVKKKRKETRTAGLREAEAVLTRQP